MSTGSKNWKANWFKSSNASNQCLEKEAGTRPAISAFLTNNTILERKIAAAKVKRMRSRLNSVAFPSVSGSEEFLFNQNLGCHSYILRCCQNHRIGRQIRRRWAVVCLKRCMQSKFGYRNDEAFSGIRSTTKAFPVTAHLKWLIAIGRNID